MMTTTAATILGRWRITAMSTWDKDYIDLVEPGFVTFAARAMGEMAFGVVTAALDCAFDKIRCDVSFDFTGSGLRQRLGRAIRTRHDYRRNRLPQRR